MAEIREPGSAPREASGLPVALWELAGRGTVRLGQPNDPGRYPALPTLGLEGAAAELRDADRGDR